MVDRTGQRGASEALSLAEVQAIFRAWRDQEYSFVRARILLAAAENGEWHADDIAFLQIEEPNVIGAAVNALAKEGLLEKLNGAGEVEHRKGSAEAAHGRASYVWRATEQGKCVARKLWYMRRDHAEFFSRRTIEAEMPGPRPAICAYESHRQFDWLSDDGERLICGKCHPMPTPIREAREEAKSDSVDENDHRSKSIKVTNRMVLR